MAIITGGKTTAASTVIASSNYKITPLISFGDQVALLTGNPLAATPTFSPSNLYTMVDTPDGLGLSRRINGLNYVWMNHELNDTTITALGSGQIQGARVSLFVFDSNWNALGGKNLIERVIFGTTNYTLNTTTGLYVDNANPANTRAFHRFCSGYLAETGFVDSTGTEVPVWMMGEEGSTNQYGLATTPDGTATVIGGLGRFSKENVVAHRNYRATNSDWTVLMSTEDNADGEVYMYVGRQTPNNPNGFWSDAGVNGSNFALYVLRVINPATGTPFVDESMPEDQVLNAQWVEVPDNVALGTPADLSTWVNGSDAGVVRSTDFERPEDIGADPVDPNTFYFTTTGSLAPNPNGKVHQVTADIDPLTGTPRSATFKNLFVSSGLGGNKAGRYDNLVADRNGNLVVQTDGNPTEVGLLYNINANANVVGNDKLDVMYQLNVDGESSGVIEVNPNALPGKSSYLFDVQALNQGQLLLMEPKSNPNKTDLNADGNSDVLWRNRTTGENTVWLMNGTNLSSFVFLPPVANLNWQMVDSGDFNADGRSDILWHNTTTGENSVWLMNGTTLSSGVFLPPVANLNWQMSASGDLNADGNSDVLWRNKTTGENSVWLMNGTNLSSGVFLPQVADLSWQMVDSADFNADGRSDILWRNTTTGENSVWLMNGTTFSSGVFLTPVADLSWQMVGSGDFNADGQSDITWRNNVTGENSVWLMNGTTLSSFVFLPPVADLSWQIAG